MALFKKKREELPAEEFTLPEPPSMSAADFSDSEELPELPDLPSLGQFEDQVKQEFRAPSFTQKRGEKNRPIRMEMDEFESAQALPTLSSRMSSFSSMTPPSFQTQPQPTRKIISPI